MSVLHSLQDVIFADLPDGRAEVIHDFSKRIFTSALSPHGNIIAFAANNGKILLYDIRSFDNKHVYMGHNGKTTTLSFSRDTRYLASGDKKGGFFIHSVIDKTDNVMFTHNFNNGICFIQYCPNDLGMILILFDSKDLFLFDQNNKDEENRFRKVEGKFTAAVWSNTSRYFYVTDTEKKIKKINMDNLEIIKSYDFEEDGIITTMLVSHNEKMLLILNKRGIGKLLDLESETMIHKYSDIVSKSKYTTASFDRNDEYVLLGTKNSINQAFIAYNIVTGLITNIFHGANESIEKILVHPLKPIIYAQTLYTLYKWNISKKFRTMESVPDKTLMRSNVVYIEKEDEFDDNSSDNNNDENINVELSISDMMSCPQFLELPNDDKYPNQIKVLPFDE